MSLETILDAVGNRIYDITGVHAVYGAAASASPDDVKPMPNSFDADVTCVLWPDGGQLTAGNSERFAHDFSAHFWAHKATLGNALQTLVPFVERLRTTFRTNTTLTASCVWCLVQGYDAPTDETVNGVEYLVLSVRFRALEIHNSSDYSDI